MSKSTKDLNKRLRDYLNYLGKFEARVWVDSEDERERLQRKYPKPRMTKEFKAKWDAENDSAVTYEPIEE